MDSSSERIKCAGSSASSSLVKFRRDFYAARPGALVAYPNLISELSDSVRKGNGGRDESTVLAQAFQSLLFEVNPEGERKLRDSRKVRAFLDYIDSSGLHDFLARVL